MKGIVVCPQPRAADVGADVLGGGGTAFDAAVATAFAQMVADPFMCGLGGMGTLQFFRAEDGQSGMIDFHTRAGSLVRPDMWAADVRGRTEISGYTIFEDLRSDIGHGAIMTPGTVAGLWEAHRRLCSRPWADLVRPAAAMARDGLAVTPFVHDFWARPPMPGVADGMRRIRATEASARIFLHPEGRLWRVGEVLRNPDLAATLEALADGGADHFYRCHGRADRRRLRRQRRLRHRRRPRRLPRAQRGPGRGPLSRLPRAVEPAARQRRLADRDAAHPGAFPARFVRPRLGRPSRPGRPRHGGGPCRPRGMAGRPGLRRRPGRPPDLTSGRRNGRPHPRASSCPRSPASRPPARPIVVDAAATRSP
jgi:hypothetical protein